SALVAFVAFSQQTPRKVATKAAQAAGPEEEHFELRSPNLPPATIAGEAPATRVSVPDMTADWPAVAAARDGSLWAVYVEWDGKTRDRVLVRKQSPQGPWLDPIALDDGSGDHYSPAIVALPGGAALAVWSGHVEGDFELFSAS